MNTPAQIPLPIKAKQIWRFFNSFKKNYKGCWVWQGTKGGSSSKKIKYPRICLSAYKHYPAHRIAVVLSGRNVPTDKTVDHLCNNSLCVNPDHLAVVSIKENVLRGRGPAAINLRKTHCKNGHEFTASNTIRTKPTTGKRYGQRICRKCFRAYWVKRRLDAKK